MLMLLVSETMSIPESELHGGAKVSVSIESDLGIRCEAVQECACYGCVLLKKY